MQTLRRLVLYIFWILHQTTTHKAHRCRRSRCISFESYIKPQPSCLGRTFCKVVYLLNPTSNHNSRMVCHPSLPLYIFWILHQTTTTMLTSWVMASCISFESYIKPQLIITIWLINKVVYLLNPTSNHNSGSCMVRRKPLYIFWILHQTTTHQRNIFLKGWLYIFWILHQTTTGW